VAQHRVEAFGVVLDRGDERQPGELGQTGVAYDRSKLEIAEGLETIPVGCSADE
jgi:hypothetical protein